MECINVGAFMIPFDIPFNINKYRIIHADVLILILKDGYKIKKEPYRVIETATSYEEAVIDVFKFEKLISNKIIQKLHIFYIKIIYQNLDIEIITTFNKYTWKELILESI